MQYAIAISFPSRCCQLFSAAKKFKKLGTTRWHCEITWDMIIKKIYSINVMIIALMYTQLTYDIETRMKMQMLGAST